MLEDISFNIAEAIPYQNFKEKIQIVKQEIAKDRYVEIWDMFIYSAEKWRDNKKGWKDSCTGY